MEHPKLTVPRSEVDTFAIAAAINHFVRMGIMRKSGAIAFKRRVEVYASQLLAGQTVLTYDDAGNTFETKLADEPRQETK